MRTRKQVLENLRTELMGRLQKCQVQLSRVTESLSPRNEVFKSLQIATYQDISAIDRALRRIAQGEGNRCEACGCTIDARRLALLPQATCCSKCATVSVGEPLFMWHRVSP